MSNSDTSYDLDFLQLPEIIDGAIQDVPPTGIITQVLHDSERRKKRPKRMALDVWAFYRELCDEGGLLDYAEDIAAITKLEMDIRNDTEMSLREKTQTVLQLVKEKARIRDRHLNAQQKLQNILTLDGFRIFLDGLFEILSEEVDQGTLQNIGQKMTRLVNAVRAARG